MTNEEPGLLQQVIYVGQVFASRKPGLGQTLLGSCVSACLYDEVAQIGGMNHFLLPGKGMEGADAARYGVHAMELLINSLMTLGADRRRLQAKVFGGADLHGFGKLRVGERNREFVREFLETEGIPIRAERLGGHRALQVRFYTATAKALVRPLVPADRPLLDELAKQERELRRRIGKPLWEPPPDYLLFE